LYDLSQDIGESKNLLKTHPEKAKELHDRMLAWREAVKAPVPTTVNPKYDPNAKWPPGKKKGKKKSKKK
jgi:hypothetical protein